MSDDCFHPFVLSAVSRKKVSASFNGGAISNDGDLLLREANRQSKGHLDSIELLDEERCVAGAETLPNDHQRGNRWLSGGYRNRIIQLDAGSTSYEKAYSLQSFSQAITYCLCSNGSCEFCHCRRAIQFANRSRAVPCDASFSFWNCSVGRQGLR